MFLKSAHPHVTFDAKGAKEGALYSPQDLGQGFSGTPSIRVDVYCVLRTLSLHAVIRTTRANLRLPTCSTTVVPGKSLNDLSLTRSRSNRTPPCSMARIASEVLVAKPACLSTCATGKPSLPVATLTSAISSGK